MAPKLAYTVDVKDPKTGEAVSFGPGDDVPDWAVEQISFDGAYVPGTKPAKKEPQKQEEPTFDPAQDVDADDLPKLTNDQLKAYAEAHNITVSASAKKDDLIAAIVAPQ